MKRHKKRPEEHLRRIVNNNSVSGMECGYRKPQEGPLAALPKTRSVIQGRSSHRALRAPAAPKYLKEPTEQPLRRSGDCLAGQP